MGHCISLVKPTTAPVQKLLINKTFFDEVNLDQQSNYPRQKIPGLPGSKMAETVNLPGNDTKYYVHSSSVEIMNSANIQNGSGMVNTTRDQAPQKKSNKGTEYMHHHRHVMRAERIATYRLSTHYMTIVIINLS